MKKIIKWITKLFSRKGKPDIARELKYYREAYNSTLDRLVVSQNEARALELKVSRLLENIKLTEVKYQQVKAHLRAHRLTVAGACSEIQRLVLNQGKLSIKRREALENLIMQVRSTGIPDGATLRMLEKPKSVPQLPREIEAEMIDTVTMDRVIEPVCVGVIEIDEDVRS